MTSSSSELAPRVAAFAAGGRPSLRPPARLARGARPPAARRWCSASRWLPAALWVLDEAFWRREPGTAIRDHLASGLVPAALAALLALVYPRLRPGARAIAALAAGLLMIVAGVVDGART
jgi:hypothetical protein